MHAHFQISFARLDLADNGSTKKVDEGIPNYRCAYTAVNEGKRNKDVFCNRENQAEPKREQHTNTLHDTKEWGKRKGVGRIR